MRHPDEIENQEFQLNARADYLSEAFGDEARLLNEQAGDEMAMDNGFTSYSSYRSALLEQQEKIRGAVAIRMAHNKTSENDIPF